MNLENLYRGNIDTKNEPELQLYEKGSNNRRNEILLGLGLVGSFAWMGYLVGGEVYARYKILNEISCRAIVTCAYGGAGVAMIKLAKGIGKSMVEVNEAITGFYNKYTEIMEGNARDLIKSYSDLEDNDFEVLIQNNKEHCSPMLSSPYIIKAKNNPICRTFLNIYHL